MKFFKKLLLLVSSISGLILCQMYLDDIGSIEFSFLHYHAKLGIFTLLALLLAKTSVVFLVKTCCRVFVKFAFRRQFKIEQEELKKIAGLIVAPDDEIRENINKLTLDKKFILLKQALAIKSGLPCQEPTGIPELDTMLHKSQIRAMLSQNRLPEAVDTFYTVLKHCPTYLPQIQSEILELCAKAKLANMEIDFNPKKPKYNLSQKFLDEYKVSITLAEFQASSNLSQKLKIISNAYKHFPNSIAICQSYLDYLRNNKSANINEIVLDVFIRFPNRQWGQYIIEPINFDLIEQKLNDISDSDPEKQWFLLDLATRMRDYTKIKEMLSQIQDINPSDISEYLYKYFNIIKQDDHIIKLLKITG